MFGKNSSNKLMKPLQDHAKLVIQTSKKERVLKTYNKAVNNPINRNQWQKRINEKLQNSDSHQTLCYTTLLPNFKIIGCK